MLKVFISILSIVCISYPMQIATVKASDKTSYLNSSLFDSESTKFSQMGTLKTWVADKYHKDSKLMQTIQKNAAMTVPQNPFSIHFAMPIQNDSGVKQYFGKSLPTIEAIELSFLQFVNALSQKKDPITLEIAAGMGNVSWKVPFTFVNKGMHYANELSKTMMKGPFNKLVTHRLQGTNLDSYITKIPGDCFDILKTNSELKGKCDAIFVTNLEHFFNPQQHQLFLKLLEDLLAPGGQAFLCAHSFVFGEDTKNPLYLLFRQQKEKTDIYPGFAQYTVTFTQIKDTEATVKFSISEAIRPKDDAPITKETLKEPVSVGEEYFPEHGGFRELIQGTQRVTSNAFSPTIYRNSIKPHSSLEVTDAFFVDQQGARQDKWGKNISYAAVIIQKK